MNKKLSNAFKAIVACALAAGLMPLPAFAGGLQVGVVASGEAAVVTAQAVKASVAKKAKAKKISVTVEKKVKYTGKAVKPTVKVSAGAKSLKAGKDYKLTYLDKNKRAISAKKVKKTGTYYVKVAGKGSYKRQAKTVKFSVYSKGGKRWVAGRVVRKAYTAGEFDVEMQEYAKVLDDASLIALSSDDFVRLYFSAGSEVELYKGKSKKAYKKYVREAGEVLELAQGFYLDGRDYVDMPAVVEDFFKASWEYNYGELSYSKWLQLIAWCESAGWDAEKVARTMRFFDPALGPIELDENGEWAASERAKYQKYVDAMKSIIPKLKPKAEGCETRNAHGGLSAGKWKTHIFSNYRKVHHPAIVTVGRWK